MKAEERQMDMEVVLVDNVLQRHSRTVPAHAGYTTQQFQWRDTLRKLKGKIGRITGIFKDSKHTNVTFEGNQCIGIDCTEIQPARIGDKWWNGQPIVTSA